MQGWLPMLHSVTATGHPVNLAFYPVPFCRGVPRDTTVRQDRLLVRTSLQNIRLTSTTLHGIQLAVRTVRKILQSAGLRGCVAAKQPHLRPQIVKAKLRFARQHKDWTVDSGTMFYGPMKVPFRFSVEQSGLL